jgi:type VI secretion system secreted protein VgrG
VSTVTDTNTDTSVHSQAQRHLTIETPLPQTNGEDALLLEGFGGVEMMSRPFAYQLNLASSTSEVTGEQIVGKNVTFSVDDLRGQTRHFNGYVSRFAYSGQNGRLQTYMAEVVPWLWFLTRTTDCRSFEKKTTPEIIKAIFDKDVYKTLRSQMNDATGYELQLTDKKKDGNPKYPTREYCAQYNESDFNFVSRLMEEEGICYFFKHDQGQHKLIVTDKVDAYYQSNDTTFDFGNQSQVRDYETNLLSLRRRHEFRPGRCSQADFNEELPQQDLQTSRSTKLSIGDNQSCEVYEFPGYYADRGEGEKLTDVRIEEQEAATEVLEASGSSRWLGPGVKIVLNAAALGANGNATDDSYVVTRILHNAHVGADYQAGNGGAAGGGSGGGSGAAVYSNTFSCITSTLVCRPSRVTPKPHVYGAQSAIVVGPDKSDGASTDAEEIYPDDQGRVRIRFHWDRTAKTNNTGSCWSRVAQLWAGAQWGAMFLPRVGHEVIVEFLDGDVDRPVIVGHVYNGSNKPPYDLPTYKTLSCIKSNSSKGGGGFNELRFDDKKGKEQVFIHAQNRMDVRVGGTLFETTGGDRHESIGVPADDSDKPGGNHRVTVGGDHDLAIGSNMFAEIAKNLNQTVHGDVNESFEGAQSTIVGTTMQLNAQQITFEASETITFKVGGNFVQISSVGVTIVGDSVLINSGGVPVGADAGDVTLPLLAAVADSGKPGALNGSGSGGAPQQREQVIVPIQTADGVVVPNTASDEPSGDSTPNFPPNPNPLPPPFPPPPGSSGGE